jgi:hypothetical protein
MALSSDDIEILKSKVLKFLWTLFLAGISFLKKHLSSFGHSSETTDQVLDETMWEETRPWEEKWESLKVNESIMTVQELDDEDRQVWFWRRRPDGFVVNEKEHIVYILEFKRFSNAGHEYVAETQKLPEVQHLVVTQGLQKLFRDTQWTVDQMSFVTGHKSVSASIWHDLLLKFSIRKEDRVKVIKNLGRTLLDELENLFRSYWDHRLGVPDGLFQVLGHSVRVKTQEVQGHHLQGPEHHVGVTVY